MNITLNIGLEVSKRYLPEGATGMQLQYEHVKEYLEITIGAPVQIGLAQSGTEKPWSCRTITLKTCCQSCSALLVN